MYSVYIHTSPSMKVYIGITSQDPERRWQNGRGYAKNPYFMNAIIKYGWINFKHEVLYKGLTKKEAEALEVKLIEEYNATDERYGYNISLGGSSNGKHSEKTKEKMSEAAKRNKNYKILHTDEVVRKRANSQRGHTVTDETKKKIGDSHRGSNSVQSKSVVQLDLSGNEIRIWPCIMDVERETGYKNTAISRCCKNKRPTAYGYKWRYLNVEDDKYFRTDSA